MKVVHINTFDQLGGAARAAYRLHQGLQRIGQTSQMFVLRKDSSDPNVIRYELNKGIRSRLRRNLRQRWINREIKPYIACAPNGLGFFTDDRTAYGKDPWAQLPESDVIQLHWVAGFLDYQGFFSSLPPRKPLVWTVHGMEALTGGCHYNQGCGKFAERCGACPQLGSSSDTDITRDIWLRKNRGYQAIAPERLHVVSPSRWLHDEVKRSSLLSRFPCSVIPNGLDTEVFRPRNPQVARDRFGIPRDAKAILFVADGIHIQRKGFDLLVEALAGGHPDGDFFLISLGPGFPPDLRQFPHKHVELVQDDQLLSQIYSAADVLVVPSLQDNLPNTIVEAISCGTPVVGFAVGGIPDFVRPGVTGFLAKPLESGDLRRAILDSLSDRERLKEMSQNCRKLAFEELSLETQAKRYAALYQEMFERSRALLP